MSQSKLDQAVLYAAKKHEGAWRAGTRPLPYITHPVEVLIALRRMDEESSEAMLIAAVLHDVLEETSTTAKEIEKQFGPEVRKLVESLTREEPEPESVKGMPEDHLSELRSQMLLEEIKQMSSDAQRIKLADRLVNIIEAKQTKHPEKVARYIRQTRRILETIPENVSPKLWRAIYQELDS